MAERNPVWAEKIKEVLERHGSLGQPMSPRAASRRTERKNSDGSVSTISHETVRGWTQGQRPGEVYIRWFADSLNEPRLPLFEAARILPTEDDIASDRALLRRQADEKGIPRIPIFRENGIEPEEEDRVHDRERFPSEFQSNERRENDTVAPFDPHSEPQEEYQEEPSRLLLALRQLFGAENVSRYQMPLMLGYASAGTGVFDQLQFPEEYSGPDLYKVRITGESMADGYPSGDQVIFSEETDAQIGDDIVGEYQGEAVFKRVTRRKRNGRQDVFLAPLAAHNPHVTQLLPREAVMIYGKARYVLMDRKEAVQLRTEYAAIERETEELKRLQLENEALKRVVAETDALKRRLAELEGTGNE